jgi:methyltransferase (TIGR00027 family)
MREAVSRTATVVALWRARESSRTATTRLFEDPFAPAFLGWRFRWALSLSRLPVVGASVPWRLIDGHWSGSRGTVVVRTRYIDDLLGAALQRGVDQVVIFGAGFDCRAYRIRGIERIRVFEVDHPMTQGKKQDVLRRCLGALPPHVAMIAIDFNTHTLDTVLPGAGYRREAQTFFICEGVTHYLSAGAVNTLLRYVARNAAVGSQMVFTYIHRAALEGSVTFAGAERTLAVVQRVGEPYTFGFDPAELPQYLAARDLRLIEDVGARTYRERYLSPLGRGHEPLAEFQRAAVVEVASERPGLSSPSTAQPGTGAEAQ